jgi:CBS domain-containing protein
MSLVEIDIKTKARVDRPANAKEEPMASLNDIMSKNPTCCTPDEAVTLVARRMAEDDVGAVPVVHSKDDPRLIGMITDRDIACRVVAEERHPNDTRVRDAMTDQVVCIDTNASLDECCSKMKQHQVRRVPVIDEKGCCCGIVSQADIARAAPGRAAGDLLGELSRPTEKSARV